MATPWESLLARLHLSDQQVYDTVVQACRWRYRQRADEEFCQAVLSEVFISLSGMLAKDPGNAYFGSPEKFRGAVRRTAQRARGPDIRDRNPRVVTTLPDEVADRNPDPGENDFDWVRLRQLAADCKAACQRCLFDADELWRQVFQLRCEEIPVGEIKTRLGLSSVTVWRHWEKAKEVFKRNCGHGHEATPAAEGGAR